MKNRHSFVYNLFIFVLAQLVWLAILLLWIYWYITNNLIFKQVGEKFYPQIDYVAPGVYPFVGGIILLAGLSFSIVLIFHHLNVQLRITKLYDSFIANITHELKSPLSSIQLYLETIKSRNPSPEVQKEFVDQMLRDTIRLQILINSILEISALESKQNKANFEVYDTCEIISQLLKESISQFRLEEETINFTCTKSANISIDVNSFKMVLDNLIDNSIKYSKDILKINFTINTSGNNVIITFSDNGIGISSKEQKNIFNKFYRIYDDDIPNVKELDWVYTGLRR
jgi:signal transduction histidine kinase